MRPSIIPIESLALNAKALKSHLIDIKSNYRPPAHLQRTEKEKKQSPEVMFVNLIDKSGSQGLLGRWLYATFQLIHSKKGLDIIPLPLDNISNTVMQSQVYFCVYPLKYHIHVFIISQH